MNQNWLILLEHAERNWAAYAPDLPGCVATGRTRAETLQRMREAIALHLDGLREDGMPLPRPSTRAEKLSVAA